MLFKQIMASNDKELDIKVSTSPEEALEWIQANETDCILSDYNMPEMNGVEFTKRLREVSQIPVILYTNQSKDEVLDQAFEAGVSDYVQKDNDAMHYILLLRRIKNAVDKHRLEMMIKKEQ